MTENAVHDLEEAINQNRASWSQYILARFGSKDSSNTPELRKKYEEYEPKLLKAFAASHGNIVDFYPCDRLRAAVILTSKNEFCLTFPWGTTESSEAEQLLANVYREAGRVENLLGTRSARRCLEMLFDCASQILSVLDEDDDDKKLGKNERVLGMVTDDLKDARQEIERAAKRFGQNMYLLGVLLGILFVGLVTFLSGWLEVGEELLGSADLVVASGFSGGVGAAVSVLNRTRFRGLVVDVDAGSKALLLHGVFRPIVGAVFGFVSFFILSSELLPVRIPEVGPQQVSFFTAVGFMAGFSERFAQDLLVMTERHLIHKGRNSED